MYPCITELQGIILKDFLKLWHQWKLTNKRPGAPDGVEKATGLVVALLQAVAPGPSLGVVCREASRVEWAQGFNPQGKSFLH